MLDRTSAEPPARVAIAYNHVYPESVGGAERYYWALTRELAKHRPITYLTSGAELGSRRVERDGVELIGLGGPDFRIALAAHLARVGDRYGLVQCAGIPTGAVAAARIGRWRHHTPLIADWIEHWPLRTWREMSGRAGGLRWLPQQLGVHGPDMALTMSQLHARNLRASGWQGEIIQVAGFLPDHQPPPDAWRGPREPLLVFAGRLDEVKRASLIPPVLAHLREADPAWRGIMFGDGPEREAVIDAARRSGVEASLHIAGFAPWDDVTAALRRARVLVAPSKREGFGIIVLEAAAEGVPSVLVAGPDNAATELIDEGDNGAVSATADPGDIAAAVLSVATDDAPARARAWFDRAVQQRGYSVEAAAARLEALYQQLLASERTDR